MSGLRVDFSCFEGEDNEDSKDGDGPCYKLMYSCTPSAQKSRSMSGRKVHATTYTPEVGTIASTTTTQASPTSAKTPVKPVKTENVRNSSGSAGGDACVSLSPTQTSSMMTHSNSNSSLSSSGSCSKAECGMLSPEAAGPGSTPRCHTRGEKTAATTGFSGISPESQSTLRRHILGHSSAAAAASTTAAVKLKDEPGINKEPPSRSGCKDDQAINLSTSPRAADHAAKPSDKHGGAEQQRAGPAHRAPLPYRDLMHQSHFRDHSSTMPLNLVNTAPSPSLNSTVSTSSSSENKDTRNSATSVSRCSSRDSALSRPSAPVNPAAETPGGGLSAGAPPGLLPPWAGLPYPSMGYMLPWDPMFRELCSLPEEERRRRLLEMGYIPPHFLVDAGLDPRFPGSAAAWSQGATASTAVPVPLVVKDNSKTKIKSESNGQQPDRVRDRSPLRREVSAAAAKPESSGCAPAARRREPGPSDRVDIKADEGPSPRSRHSQVSCDPASGGQGQAIKADVMPELKTQVDIKPFNVVPQQQQPAASNNNKPPDEPSSGM